MFPDEYTPPEDIYEMVKNIFIPLVETLDQTIDGEKGEEIAKQFAGRIEKSDEEIVRMVLIQPLSGPFGQCVFKHLVKLIDDLRFDAVLAGIRHILSTDMPKGISDPNRLMQVCQDMADIRRKNQMPRTDLLHENLRQADVQIRRVMKGDARVFQEQKFLKSLPGIVERLFEGNKESMAENMLDQMAGSIAGSDPDIRIVIAGVMAEIGENLFSEGRFELLEKLSHRLINWIILENKLSDAYKSVCNLMRNLAWVLIQKEQFDRCSHILETFNAINAGKLNKDVLIQSLAGNILKNIATDDVLDPILTEFKTNAANGRKDAANRLIQIGAGCVEPLLNTLRDTEDRYERSRIIQLLTDMGRPALPALITQLKEGDPWYYMRNLVLLIGRIGDESHLELLRPMMAHRSLRVRRETLNSIYSIGGKKSEDIILKNLPPAEDSMKLDIIGLLGGMKSQQGVSVLVALLQSGALAESKIQEELMEKICVSLGKIGSPDAIPVLTELLDRKKTGKGRKHIESSKVKFAAANAIVLIKEKVKDAESSGNNMEKELDHETTIAMRIDPAMFDAPPGVPVGHNPGKEFIDTMEKNVQESNKKDIWKTLYERLSLKDQQELEESLKEHIIAPDRMIYKQGVLNSRLYFLEEGEAVLTYDQEGEEIWIKTLQPGDITGGDGFFNSSVSTTSMITITEARFKYLEKNQLEKWQNEFKKLLSGLKAHYFEKEEIFSLLQKNGMERRVDKRLDINGDISFQILDDTGKSPGKYLKGMIINISLNGMAFFVKMRENNAREFVGKNLKVKYFLFINGKKHYVNHKGSVVAVRSHQETMQSVHAKFDAPLLPLHMALDGPCELRTELVDLPEKKSGHDDPDRDFLVTSL